MLRELAGERVSGTLFLKHSGKQVTDKDLRRSIEKCRRSLASDGYRNALKIHLHTFRHFYGSKYLAKTKDLLATSY